MEKEIKNLFIKIFTGIAVGTTFIIIAMFNLSYKSELSKITIEETINLQGHNRVLVRIISAISDDVLFLSKLPDIKDLDEYDHINGIFLEFSKSKKVYDQIRYLDSQGNEIIRVNGNNGLSEMVDSKDLQNKKGRYYFDDTYKLLLDQIFISPLDLNIERGEVEVPIKPMLRIGTPVYDNNNKKKGIVLLNYFGADLINELKANMKDLNSSFQLLNNQGYWLSSDIKEDEWGFMFAEKNNLTFENRFSKKAWDIINSKDSGQFFDKQGIFTFNTVYPLSISHLSSSGSKLANSASEKSIEWKNYKWKLVSYLSKDQVNKLTLRIKRNFIMSWILFMIFNLIISRILAISIISRKKADQERLDAEKKYRVLFEEAGESIVVTRKEETIMANTRTEELFEYNQEELKKMPLEALIHIDDRKHVIEKHKKQCNEKITSMIFEARILTKKGKVKWAEIRATNLEIRSETAILYFFLDISKRKEIELKLQELATTDSLTGCYNRRFFTETLEKEIERSRRMKFDISVVMVDFDHFKNINDSYGHDIGDVVIKKFVELTSIEIRNIDTLGRLGGEEFALILPNCSEKNGINCAERIRETIQNCIINQKGVKISFTASFGVAKVMENDNIETILKKVDKALYKAKNTGRNKTMLYTDEL